MNRILHIRQSVSLSGNKNIFDKLKKKADQVEFKVFGDQGFGLYQDSVLAEIQKKVVNRTDRLEKLIESRQSNESLVNSTLTILAGISILVVWVRMQRFIGGGKPSI